MIALQRQEALVLWAVQHRPDEPLGVIAKELRLRETVVRSVVTKLAEAGLIHRIPLIRYRALGFTEYVFYVSLNSAGSVRESFMAHCMHDERVNRVEELGGSYDYAVAFLARDVADATQFIEGFGERLGSVVGQKSLGVLSSYTGYGRTYLVGKPVKPPVVIGDAPAGVWEIDELDHAILRELSQDGDRSQREVARELGEQLSKVSYRVSRMFERGILAGFIYGVRAGNLPVHRFRFAISGAAIRNALSLPVFRHNNRFGAPPRHIVCGSFAYQTPL
jgi:DNA-binding Lrp family transcriptional regulator